MVDQRVAKGSQPEEAVLTAIASREPDRRVYLNPDLVDADDPEVHQHDLYPFAGSLTTWYTGAFDRIKFLMPSAPPLLYWDRMNKVRESLSTLR